MTLDTVPKGAAQYPRAVAVTMSNDWKPVIQQDLPDTNNIRMWFDQLPKPARPTSTAGLVEAISAEEIDTAIKQPHRGKSTSPDRIPNDWYIDFKEEITPVLLTAYDNVLQTGRVPKSFTSATIHCIPKCSKPRTRLDYRPIALLNSNYKIFTKILASRLAPVLGYAVQDSQSGFVRGRNIHNTNDLAFLAKHLAKSCRISRNALVVCYWTSARHTIQ